jgi:hypothetical protein
MSHETPSSLPIRGVHVDCRAQMLRYERIVEIFHDLSRWGYNTVLLEYEDRFPYAGQLEQVPASDALTRRQIRDLNAVAESLGLQIVPLVHCLAHLGYVMRFRRFGAFSEAAGAALSRAGHGHSRHPRAWGSTVCPSHPKSLELFKRMAGQVLEAHPDARYFHMGGDEAHPDPDCIWCRSRLRKVGLPRVLAEHYVACAQWLRRQGPDPIIWCDMPLGHPEALDELREHVIIMDWDYWSGITPNATAKVWGVPGRDFDAPRRWPAAHRQLFAEYIFDEKGCPRPFPYARFLRDRGFRTILAPAVRCSGDNHCVPMPCLPKPRHLENVVGASRTAVNNHLLGMVVTSWAVRRSPWPFTEYGLIAGGMTLKNPRVSREAMDLAFAAEHFGMADARLVNLHRAMGSNIWSFTDSRPNMNPKTGQWPGKDYAIRLRDISRNIPGYWKGVRWLRSGLAKAAPLLAILAPRTARQKRNVALWKWAYDVLSCYADLADELLKAPGTHEVQVLKAYRTRLEKLADRSAKLLGRIYTERTMRDEQQTRFGGLIGWLDEMIATSRSKKINAIVCTERRKVKENRSNVQSRRTL